MKERQVGVIWEIDYFPPEGMSEYQIAKAVYATHFKDQPEPDAACVFKVVEGGVTTLVDLGQAEESREQRLERLALLLLNQIKELDDGTMFECDITADSNPVTRQLKAILS